MAAMMIAAGVPMRWLAGFAGAGAMLVMLYAMTAPYRRARLTSFLDPWNHAGDAGLPGRAGPDRDRLGRAVRPRAGRVGPEDLLPARGPHRLHPRDHRRGGRADRDLRRSSSCTARSPGRACGSPSRPRAATPRCWPRASRRSCSARRCLNLWAVLGIAPADGRAAAVHLLRVDEPRRPARRLRAARERRPRRLRAPAGHQRGPRCATIHRRWSRRRS